MRKAALLLEKGIRTLTSSALPIAMHYLEQRALAEMGITTPRSSLSPFMTECFLILDAEFRALRAPPKEP